MYLNLLGMVFNMSHHKNLFSLPFNTWSSRKEDLQHFLRKSSDDFGK